MSDDSDAPPTPPDIKIEVEEINVSDHVLPIKSRERYEYVYQKFMDWKFKNNIESMSENILLRYFDELSKEMKPTSLWATYSMLKATLNINELIDISTYSQLIALLKIKSTGFKSKKTKILTTKNVDDFLNNASDDRYLLSKVILIFGITGACRKQELRNIQPSDVEDTGTLLVVNIPDLKTNKRRTFVVSDNHYKICKRYMDLRPPGEDTKFMPFFLHYRNGKCSKQSIGINKIGTLPKEIAEYLKLPDPKDYTGHCFRRSSAAVRADAGNDHLFTRKRSFRIEPSDMSESFVFVDQLPQNGTPNITDAPYITDTPTPNITQTPHKTNTPIITNSPITPNKTDTPIKIVYTINNNASTSNNNVLSSYTLNTESGTVPTNVFNNCTVTINHYHRE